MSHDVEVDLTIPDRIVATDIVRASGDIETWNAAKPFRHLVIDGFLDLEFALSVAREFPAHDDKSWYIYDNAIEVKKAMNSWDRLGPATYRLFSWLNAHSFVSALERLTQCRLFPDFGLNGGGLHSHRRGGKLNTHLDYSLHPKLGLERRLNLIIYVTPGWEKEWGGHLGFWSHDADRNRPAELVSSIPPLFNRAVIFDTTQNSWHGLPEPIACPDGVTRNSLAIYYLSEPRAAASRRGRALFAPSKEQEGDPEVLDLIRRRSSVRDSKNVYVKK